MKFWWEKSVEFRYALLMCWFGVANLAVGSFLWFIPEGHKGIAILNLGFVALIYPTQVIHILKEGKKPKEAEKK